MARFEVTQPLAAPIVSKTASATARSNIAQAGRASRALAATIAVVLVAWALAWRLFGPQELGQDGFLSADLGYERLAAMAAFTARDVHPPLYYALLHGWFALVGVNALGAKFLGIASAALAVAGVQRLGARLGGAATGLLGALLLALSPTFVRLSTTARDFVPGIALSVLSLLLILHVLAPVRPERRTVAAIGLAAATALALLTSYLHWAFWLAEIGVCLAAWRLNRREAAKARHNAVSEQAGGQSSAGPFAALGALALGVLATAPWYAMFVPQLLTKLAGGVTGYAKAPASPTFASLGQALLTAVTGSGSGRLAAAAIGGWLLALLLGIGVACRRRGAPRGRAGAEGRAGDARRPLVVALLLTALVLGAVEVAGILWRWQLPKSLATYLVVLLPAVALFQAIALTRAAPTRRALAAACLAVAVAGQLAWYVPLARSAPIDWSRDAPLNYLATHVQPGDGLIFSDHARRAQYVLASNWNAATRNAARTSWPAGADGGCTRGVTCAVIMSSDATETYLHSTPDEAARTVAAVAATSRRIWFAESGEAPGTPRVGRLALAAQAYPLWEQQQDATDLQLFAVGTPDQQWRGTALLGGAVRLSAAAFSGQVRLGDPVLVHLVWEDVTSLPASYTVFVHLDDATGHLAAQQDGLPVTGLRPTTTWRPGERIDDHHGVALPPDLPPGDYRLNVGLYAGQQRLAMADGTNAIQLGVVHVER